MGLFSSSTEKSVLERYPNNPDITSQRGSGAEQDHYGEHFGASTETIKRGVDKGLDKLRGAALAKGEGAEQDRYNEHFRVGTTGYDKLKEAARTRGDGAEQDRYNAHFSPAAHSLDAQIVPQAVRSIAVKGKNASFFGLGYDGQQRARLLAGSGTGAEQDRLGNHFNTGRDAVAAAAKKVEDGAKRVQDGAKGR